MRYFLRCLLGFILCLVFTDLQATHIIGGDMTYKCLGNKRYEFTLTIYSECDPESGIVLDNAYTIWYYAPSLGITSNSPQEFTVGDPQEYEVEVFCKSKETSCNGGTERGIIKTVYTGQVVLSDYAEDWHFFWQKSSRSEEIDNLVVPETEEFFLLVEMNSIDAPCNNSPVFESSPVLFPCIGKEKSYNHNATDLEGDQLQYAFSVPLKSITETVTFSDDYDEEYFMPMTDTAIQDINTGELRFTPTAQFIGITDITVTEYRDDKKIGSVTRGMQISGTDCTNTPPELSDFSDMDTSYIAVCAGDFIDLTIEGTDPDEEDILFMRLISGNEEAFKVKQNLQGVVSGEFKWETKPEDAGTHYFTIEVEDNGCPQIQTFSKTYVIEIHSVPEVELGTDRTIGCKDTTWIIPTVSGGAAPYTFSWSHGASTDSVYVVPDTYILEVTDQNGCIAKDTIQIISELQANFSYDDRCLGNETVFTDLSIDLGGTITEWAWDLGDGNTSEEQDPTHTYAAAGTYEVVLTITDDNTCTDSRTRFLTICETPEVSFQYADSCRGNLILFTDLTSGAEACEIRNRTWDWGDGTTSVTGQAYASKRYDTAGVYQVNLTVETAAGCTNNITQEVTIYHGPEYEIVESDFFLDCSDPETTLHTTQIQAGYGDLSFEWTSNEEVLGNLDSLVIDSAGVYIFSVLDEMGCSDQDTITVRYPLQAAFTYSPMCEEFDAIEFTDLSVANVDAIDSYTWDFGDGNTSTEQHPVHTYTELGTYQVTLTVTDLGGCESSIQHPVYYTYMVDSTFDVTPNLVTICVSDPVYGIAPVNDPDHGSHFNEFHWYHKNLDTGDSTFISNKSNPKFTFRNTGRYEVFLKLIYNRLNDVNEGCTKYFSEIVDVKPELKVELDASRMCVDKETLFTFRRTAGDTAIKIVSSNWTFKNMKSGHEAYSTALNPVFTFPERQWYEVTLEVEDSLGCRYTEIQEYFADKVATPDFDAGVYCKNDSVEINADFTDNWENITDYYFIVGEDTVEGTYRRPFTIKTIFKQAGKVPATLTVYNRYSGCEESITKNVTILDIPEANFRADTVCFGDSTAFENLSSVIDDKPLTYQWNFGDGEASSEENPSHLYEKAGEYTVQLTAWNQNGCPDIIERSIYVQHIPTAGFAVTNDILEANTTLYFTDQSSSDVNSYFWDFGDGTTSTAQYPEHSYEKVDKYRVSLIVSNATGCTDTLRQLVDLNAYLEIPTAFTPNDDGLNDRLNLIHYGIKEIDCKIYNRWGQIVFESQDPNEGWDGRLNGRLQQDGVYIVHVKATGANNKPFNLSEKVSLIY